MKKRITSILLCLLLIIGMLPVTAFAQEISGTDVSATELTDEQSGENVSEVPDATITSEPAAQDEECAIEITDGNKDEHTEDGSEMLSPTVIEEEPEDVLGAVEYPVWVNGVQITSAQKEVTCGSGRAVFLTTGVNDYTLTLYDAAITQDYTKDVFGHYGIYSELPLKLVVNGECDISVDYGDSLTGEAYGIKCTKKLDVWGTGRLNIYAASCQASAGIIADSLDFTGDVTLNVVAEYAGTSKVKANAITTANGFYFENGTFDLYGDSNALIVLPSYAETYTPLITVGNDRYGSDEIKWNHSTPISSYKHVRIKDNCKHVYIAGEAFTESKKVIKCGDGTATLLDTAPRRLVLENASITADVDAGSTFFEAIQSDYNLDIELKGENTIDVTGNNAYVTAINVASDDYAYALRFFGNGKLNINVSSNLYADAIHSGHLDFYGGKLNVSANTTSTNKKYYARAVNNLYTPNIHGGSLILSASQPIENADTMIFYQTPSFDYSYDRNPVYVSENPDGSNAVQWDGMASLCNYKYAEITEKGFGVWVNGEEFTKSNREIFCDGGTATLDTTTTPYTLTLDNAYIDIISNLRGTVYYGGICSANDLRIVLEGNNYIGKYDKGRMTTTAGIVCAFRDDDGTHMKHLTLEGNGTLEVEMSSDAYCMGILCDDLAVNSGTYDISALSLGDGSKRACAIQTYNAPKINGGSFEIEARQSKGAAISAFGVSPVFSEDYENAVNVTVCPKTGSSAYSDWDGETSLTDYKGVKLTEVGLGIWVNGNQFSAANAKTGIKCGEGRATLDMTTTPWTVTLEDAVITNVTVQCPDGYEVYAGGIFTTKDIIIKLVGSSVIRTDISCNIVSGDESLARYAYYGCIAGRIVDVTLTGDGYLDLNGYDALRLESDTYGKHGVLTIDGGNTTGTVDGIYCNGSPAGIIYRSGSFELHSDDPESKWWSFNSGGSLAIADDAVDYAMWLYDFEDPNAPEWQRCIVSEFEEYGDNFEYCPSGFKFVPVKKINEVKFTGYRLPHIGETAGQNLYYLCVPYNGGYQIAENNTFWYNDTDKERMDSDDTFVKGKSYYLFAEVHATGSNRFDETDLTVTFNGEGKDVDFTSFDSVYCVASLKPVEAVETVYVNWYNAADEPEPYDGIEIIKGEVFDEPYIPEREGNWMVEGWYTDRQLTKKWTPGTAVNSNLELFPKWVETVVISWYLDAEDEEPVAGIEFPKGETYDGPAEPGRDGFVFGGWYTDRQLTKKWTPGTAVNSDLELFPKWVEVVVISWYLDAEDEEPVAGIEFPKGETYDGPPEPGKEGFVFGGWYTDRQLTKKWTPGTVVNSDLTLFPKWLDETSFTVSPVNTCEVGETVTMTATGGSTYKFYYECAGSWVRLQDFSENSTCTWKPAKGGDYNLYCDIKKADGKTEAKKITYKVTGTEPLRVSLSFQYASPQTAGTTIKITANATGGKGTLKYKFYSECNGVWTKLWDYDTRTTYNWHATTVGTHTLYCDVMDEAGDVVCAVVSYQIVKGTEFVADLNANRISGQLVGTEIRLLGGSSNGVGEVQYKFYYELDGSWVRLCDFSTQDYFLWTPTKAGYYNIYMDAKDSAGHTASKRLCITIDEGETMKVTGLTADPAVGAKGTPVTLTAVTNGGSGTITYKFYYEIGGNWVRLQDFSEKTTCSFTPTKAGTYHIYVDAIDGTKNTQCLMINYTVDS